MAENPLLPSAELRALYALVQQASSLAASPGETSPASAALRRAAAALPGREALLSGTILQLTAGDVLVAEPGDPAPSALLQSRPAKAKQPNPSAPEFAATASSLLFAAGLAAATRRAGTDRLVLVFARAGAAVPHWKEALTWAQTDKLPLIIACADPSGAEAFRPSPNADQEALTWSAAQKLTARLKLPVLSVDGEDAVAVYRVMQESVLRARSGNGPAVLWAMLPSARDLRRKRAAHVLPLGRLQHFLQTRKIEV